MMKLTTIPRAMCCGLVLALAATGALAVDKAGDKANKEQRRTQQLLRKAEQEKSQLVQQKTEVEGQLKDAQGKLEDTQRKSSGKIAGLSKKIEATIAEKDALASKLADTEKQLADITAKLRSTEAEKQAVEATSANQRKAQALCETNNTKLYQHDNELLKAYESKSCSASLLQAEPLTGLKRAQVENLMEDYRNKLDELKLMPAAAAQSKVAAP